MVNIKKIGIVEDCIELSDMLSNILPEGYFVETFNDGFSAILEFEQQRFDLIVVDLGLPMLSGQSILNKLSEGLMKLNKGTKVLVISGDAFQLDDLKQKNGFAGLLKPFSPAAFVEAVEKIVA